MTSRKIALVANTGWYLQNYRLDLARRIRAQGDEVVLISPKDDYVPRLTQQGFEWREIQFDRKGMNVILETIAVWRYIRLYQRVKPDLVHHFTVKPVFYGTVAAHYAQIPAVVNSVTGLGYLFTSRAPNIVMIRTLLRPIFMRSIQHPNHRMIFQHKADLEFYRASGLVQPDHALIIPGSGVDMDVFSPRPAPEDPVTLLLASRMIWDKGVADYVEAVRRLRLKFPALRAVLAGNPDLGNPSSIPESQLRTWHDEGVVEWIGHQDDMSAVIGSSHIVVLPTHYGEGVPRILIEAAAMEKPVVASDVAGCREVIVDGRNGLLAQPQDIDALTSALEQLITDSGLGSDLGREGRRMIAERFSEAKINQATLDVYRSLQM